MAWRGKKCTAYHPLIRSLGGEAGFTLVELVIASSLMVLLIGGGYSLVRASLLNWNQDDTMIGRQQNLRIAADRLIREIRQGVPPVTVVTTPVSYVEFEDQDGRIIRYTYDSGDDEIQRSVNGEGNNIVAQNVTSVEFTSVSGGVEFILESGDFHITNLAIPRWGGT